MVSCKTRRFFIAERPTGYAEEQSAQSRDAGTRAWAFRAVVASLRCAGFSVDRGSGQTTQLVRPY